RRASLPRLPAVSVMSTILMAYLLPNTQMPPPAGATANGGIETLHKDPDPATCHPPERSGGPGPETWTKSRLEENPGQAVASTQNSGYRSRRRSSEVTLPNPAEE